MRRSQASVLLTYAAVERYVDLCLWVDFQLDDEKPDYSLVTDRLDRAKYDEAGRRIFGRDYKPRGLDGPLMFSNGAQLLAALAPTRLDMNHLGPLRGLSSIRNKCEYEHGFLPKAPAVNDADHYLNKVIEIVAQSCGDERELRRRMEECRFATLEPARPS